MLHVEVMGDSASELLAGEKGHFSESSTPAVKPNSLPLSEINLPSFREKSRLSSPKVTNVSNSCTAVDSATSSALYHGDLADKFGVLNLNDYSQEVQLQRLHQHQQQQKLLRQADQTDFSGSSHKNKLSGSGDVRDIVDQLQQRHSPYKTTPATTPNLLEHQMQHQFHPPSYDQRQILKSLLGDQLSPGGDSLGYPIALPSYHPLDSLSHELNSLSQYLGTKTREESLLSHLSPSSEEFKSFAKQMDPNLMDINHNAAYGSPYYGSSSSENESIKDMKMSEYSDSMIGSNAHVSEALLLKLRQQNSLAKQHLPAVNVMDFSHFGMPKKDILARQMALSNFASSLEQEHIAKLYLNELVKENPNFLASQLFANLPVTNLPFNLGSFPNSHIESYSRKVFVGGLPPDSDEDEITASFRQFGPLIVDWPHKAETKTNFPPKGYCFLLFQDEMSVQNLMESCYQEDGKSYWCIAGASQKDKPARRVQIRPWCLVDSDFVMDGSQPLDLRKTIFVGGVPRPLKAVELAMAMNQLYGGVCYAGIDTDPELKYPKGAGRVSFSNQQSYIAAISARFVQLQFGDIDKRVEVKPYVLDDQLCDECQGQKCAGKSAPYFCANVACLQYYCEICWVQIHSRPGREFHKPLVKEGADRPKSIPPFKW